MASCWNVYDGGSPLNPGYSLEDDYPVTCVNWYDAAEFCKWLSQKSGLKVQLPMEVQWEYACRAGSSGAYAGNLDEMAWYSLNSDNKIHPVGKKKPNAWGLYDMHGNVLEGCLDWDAFFPNGNITFREDISKLVGDSCCMIRGSSWMDDAQYCRSAFRLVSPNSLWDGIYCVGFRIVIVP